MRRRRFGGIGARPRKLRPAITVKTKPAPRTAKCSACKFHITKGDEAVYVRVRTRRFHKQCAPANIGAPPSQQQGPASLPTDPREASLAAMDALENALLQKAKRLGFPDELEKAFSKYSKIKEHALRPGSEPEGVMALRLAIVELVKSVF